MKIINQEWMFTRQPDGLQMLQDIERAGRTCYKSEDKITDDSAKDFVQRMIKSGHHAMIEFAVPPTVKVITDRGVTHEIVRHRLFSYAQESTRYCNYGADKFRKEITIILPVWFYNDFDVNKETIVKGEKAEQWEVWSNACQHSEWSYMRLLDLGQSPQEARSVLPNSLKTEINIRGNVREWRHFFTLRCSPAAHPQMRDLAQGMLKGFKQDIPIIFNDLK